MNRLSRKLAKAARNLVGQKGRRAIRTVVDAWLWLVARAPLQIIRINGLRLVRTKVGHNIVIGAGLRTLDPWRLSLGDNNIIGRRVTLDARGGLVIGENCNISDDVTIWTAEHDIQSPDFPMTVGSTTIGNRVWLCYRSILLPGVSVGNGAVVATGAVVTKDVPEYTVVAGVPAKPIGSRNCNLTYQLGKNSV